MSWVPHITVACVAKKENKFLLVEEHVNGEKVLNQPAGHLEEWETLAEACKRETLEETKWDVEPQSFLGIYQYRKKNELDMYLRFAFSAELINETKNKLDEKIIRVVWLSRDEVASLPQAKLRSPMVLQCIDDYISGKNYPISICTNMQG
jgi:ADP-ribose pyrophosphatase YjhB (NUDIX family)